MATYEQGRAPKRWNLPSSRQDVIQSWVQETERDASVSQRRDAGPRSPHMAQPRVRLSQDQDTQARRPSAWPESEDEDFYAVPAPESDTDSMSPPMISSDSEPEQADPDEEQSHAFQQFSSAYMSDHTCVGPVQALFVASATDPSGSSIAYGIYGGPFSMLNSAHILRGEDRLPAHMARRTPLTTTALVRRAELRGVIEALRQLAQSRQGRICAHVCVSSAYVAKAWGTWIPQWETHGWPGEDTEVRTRSHLLCMSPHSHEVPETPRRSRDYRMMESPSQPSSDSLTGTDSSTSMRRSTRRLVDEDLLRELAALRAELIRLDTQEKARVYLYQIESHHNPAVPMASQCVDGDAPPLEPDMAQTTASPRRRMPHTNTRRLEPMRVFGPVAPLAQERYTMASPLPEDAYLRSPHLARAKSPVAASPTMRPNNSRAGTPRSRTASPMTDIARPFSPSASSFVKASPLTVSQSKLTPMPSPAPLSQGPFDGLTPTMASVALPDESPNPPPLTMEALEEHNRQTGHERPDSRTQRRWARSTRSSVKSDNAQSIIQRLTPRFLRREPKNLAPAKSPMVEEEAAPVPTVTSPRPRLRTVASQPALRTHTRETSAPLQSQATSVASPTFTAKPLLHPKRVGPSPPVHQPLSPDMQRRHEELARREQELARREVEMTRIRFEMERQRQLDPSRSTSTAPRTASEEQSDWLWDATLRRTPRLPTASLPHEPKAPMGAAPLTNMQALGAPKSSGAPLSRGSQWVMYEERLPTGAASDTTSSRSETTSSLGLFVEKGFGQTAALPPSSPYARRTASNASSLLYTRGSNGPRGGDSMSGYTPSDASTEYDSFYQ